MNTPALAGKSAPPGRPKDMAKRASILTAASRLFVQHGYGGVSMDQIAAEAGVSKLTVYSHYGDKDSLFAEAVRAHCEHGMPTELFEPAPDVPLRERLSDIAHAFLAMVMTPEAITGHRVLCSPHVASSNLPKMIWDAGPKRINDAFTALLVRRIEAGELNIDDPSRAAGHFFTLLKGELHAQAVLGNCCGANSSQDGSVDAHIESVVDLFLRAYAKA